MATISAGISAQQVEQISNYSTLAAAEIAEADASIVSTGANIAQSASEESETIAATANTAAHIGLTDAEIADAAAALGVSDAYFVETTAAAAATDATTALAVAETAEGTASVGAAAGTSTLTAALSGAAVAAKAFVVALATNPLTWIIAISGTAVAALYKISHGYEDVAESAQESNAAYESSKSELESLNSELETTQSRIAELQELKNAGKITLTEESELAQLQRENAKLERKIALQEQVTRAAAKTAADDALEALTVKGTQSNYTGKQYSSPITDVITATKTDLEHLQALQYNYESAYKAWSKMEDGDVKDNVKKDMDAYQSEIDEYKGYLSDSISEISGYIDQLDNYDSLDATGRKVVNSAKELVNDYYNTINTEMSDTEKALSGLNSYFDDSDGKNAIKNQILDMVEAGDSASEALKKLGLSMSDLGLDNSAESISALNKYFDELKTSANDAADAIDQVDGTMSGIATAMESSNSGDEYVTFKDYLDKAKELYDQGLTGTDDFKTVAELISRNIDSSAESFKKNYDNLQKYFTTDDDGNLTKSGIDRFASDLSSALNNAGGSFKNTAEAADALGISTEAFELILGRLGDYDLSKFDQSVQDVYNDLPRASESVSEAKTALEQLKEVYDGLDSGDNKDKLGEKIEDWQKKIDAAMESEDGLKDFDTTLTLQIEAELNLQQIQSKIDQAQQLITEGDKSTTNYATANAYKAQYRSTSESALGWDSGNIKVPVEYELAGNSIEELQQQLASVTDENKRMEIQAEISNLYDVQNQILDAFRDAHPEITAETNPEEAQAALDEWINSEDGKKILAELHIDTTTATNAVGDLVKDANNKLKELKKTDIDFNLNDNFDGIVNQIDKAKELLDQFRNEDGTVNLDLEGASEAQVILASLIRKKQELSVPVIMNVDTSNADADVQSTIDALQQIQSLSNDLEVEVSVGADTSETQSKIQSAASAINPEVLAKLGIDTTEFDAQINALTDPKITADVALNDGAIAGIQGQISGINAKILAKVDVDTSKVDQYSATQKTSKGTVAWDNNTSKVDTWIKQNHSASGTVNWSNNTDHVKTSFTATGTINWKNGEGSASGTAHSQGTVSNRESGLSYFGGKSRGDWSVGTNQTALINEVAPEIIVHRNGTFDISNGVYPTFKRLHKDDIVFSGAQTKALLETGRTNSYGKFIGAKSSGTATGKSFAGGSISGRAYASGTSEKTTIDWFETAIDRIERTLKKFTNTLDNTFKNLNERLSAVNSAISTTKTELSKQQTAYTGYMDKANSVKLSDSLKKQVREGAYYIYDYDEATQKAINSYKEWYEKALDAKDAIDELNKSLSELYKEAFDIVAQRYDNEFAALENRANMIDNSISLAEAQGYSPNAQSYRDLIDLEQRKKDKYQSEYKDLTDKLNSAVASGTVQKFSDEWWDMYNQILEVAGAIQEADIAMAEYEQTIRELEWDNFDFLQDRISQITSESEFLINLLESSDLFDDNGKMTSAGWATVSLRGTNYATYMQQAKDYAEELQNIESQLADDPANKDLIERKEELLKLQQESIQAAQEEKQAVIDLVQEGIEKELDALQELIDKYTSALDSAKDLHDYQKKVADYNSEISSLQKQLDAYSGDTSEESRAKIQQIKTDLAEARKNLEETQYDQYISDQKKLLDNLYTEYETVLNERLDDTDALFQEMIDSAQANAEEISKTITETAQNVGYTMTDNMSNIVSGIDNVSDVLNQITEYFSALLDVAFALATDDNGDPIINSDGTTQDAPKELSGETRKKFTVQGYADGGIVGQLKAIARSNGDDAFTINTLKKGEAVLTPEQTRYFKEFTDNLPLLYNLPNTQGCLSRIIDGGITDESETNITNYFEINNSIDHVDSYDDLIAQMCDDPKFEKMVQAMGVDRAAGKSSLAKYKYRRN